MSPRLHSYRGPVLLGDQPTKWIIHHSFASREWFTSIIHWGHSPWTWHNKNDFSFTVIESDGIKPVDVFIKASFYKDGTLQHPPSNTS